MYYLYKLTDNTNGFVYYGLTNDPVTRKNQHRRSPKARSCRSMWIARAIGSHGWENFTFEVLFSVATIEEASIAETELITTGKAAGNCYNLAAGGLEKKPRPMRHRSAQILEAYSRLRNTVSVAQELGISRGTVDRHLKDHRVLKGHIAPETKAEIWEAHEQGVDISAISRKTGVPHTTLTRFLKRECGYRTRKRCTITPEQRSTIVALSAEGLPRTEIAARFGLNIRTIYRILSKEHLNL